MERINLCNLSLLLLSVFLITSWKGYKLIHSLSLLLLSVFLLVYMINGKDKLIQSLSPSPFCLSLSIHNQWKGWKWNGRHIQISFGYSNSKHNELWQGMNIKDEDIYHNSCFLGLLFFLIYKHQTTVSDLKKRLSISLHRSSGLIV